MSQVPTIPGVPSVSAAPGSAFLQAGPQGILASVTSPSISLSLDMCNARPVFIYVTQQKDAPPPNSSPWPPVAPPPAGMPAPPPPPPAPIRRPPSPGAQKGGQIWRVFDPLAPIEKLPVWKEWTEEKEYKNGHWQPHYRQPPPPQQPPTQPPQRYRVRTEVISREADQLYRFDEPGRDWPTSRYPQAFTSADAGAAVMSEVVAALDAPAEQDGGTVPLASTPFERKVVVFGHADMCASFAYNHGLTYRRNVAIGMVMPPQVRAGLLDTGRSQGFAPCSDFNPVSGPNQHERAAENSPTGFATTPDPIKGNQQNRRVELFVIPDYKRSSGKPSKIAEIIDGIRSSLMSSAGISVSEWPAGQFPCPQGRNNVTGDAHFRVCHKLTLPPGDHQGPGSGPAYRQCQFYQQFTAAVRSLEIVEERSEERPGQQPPQQPAAGPVFDRWEWVEDAPIKVIQGEYHPPRGEHYSFYMDEMVREGVDARDLFPPAVAVAPNDRVNPEDFNLIRAGTVRVVKLDLGFWGDRRTLDVSRQAGFRRTPDRYFGLIEGQFVFLGYFETPDNAGHVRPCSEGFDQNLTPLCFQLDQALRQQGFRILIMAKAVAEDGPDKQRLKVLFPDMHLPRKFDERDPVYSDDECIRRVQMIKSYLIHQLKQDYRLPAESTPWLTTIDRQLCRDFFENNAPRLKLPHLYTLNGPTFSNPMRPEGSNVVSQAVDAVKKAVQFLVQVGYRAFVFTQEDYRRMTRKYPDNFPERGYGRTKDLLFNWFYGSTTDRNIPAPPESPAERTAKNLVPALVQQVADTHFGTQLGPDPGRAPAQESREVVDAGPARDLLRILNVIATLQQQGVPIDVFQTGDLYEMWANRRFLFEDFHPTDDPVAQMPDVMASLTQPVSQDNIVGDVLGQGAGRFAAQAGDFLKGLIRDKIKTILGGPNCTNDPDIWFRKESNKPFSDPARDVDTKLLPPEEAWNLDRINNDFALPRFTAPAGGPGTVGLATAPGQGLRTPSVDITNYRFGAPGADGSLRPVPATNYHGRGYLSEEAQRRINQIEAFEAPLRQDSAGRQEDQRLLTPANILGRNRDQGLWNRAVTDAFRRVRTTFIYGNHDCFCGAPRDGGLGRALPYYSEPGLWIEHGHRFEDSNIDGQPFGSFLTNLAYEIQELAFGEGLLDEFTMHREQSLFQPGLIQWFLFVQYGGAEFLRRFQRPSENVPRVFPFRIAANSHTHQPDLVIAQLIFKDREVAEVDLPFSLPLIGDSISVETLINGGGALLKGVLLWKKLEEWWKAWDERQGFEKWWADLNGNSLDWVNDFAGLARCVDRAIDFIRQQGENVGRRLASEARASGRSLRDAVDQNIRNQGLPGLP